jgi:hypothetical protein
MRWDVLMSLKSERAKFRIPLLDPLDQIIVSQNIIVERENENENENETMTTALVSTISPLIPSLSSHNPQQTCLGAVRHPGGGVL